jgi:hypothetical protein
MFVPFEIPYMLTRLTHCVKFEGLNTIGAGTGREKVAKKLGVLSWSSMANGRQN